MCRRAAADPAAHPTRYPEVNTAARGSDQIRGQRWSERCCWIDRSPPGISTWRSNRWTTRRLLGEKLCLSLAYFNGRLVDSPEFTLHQIGVTATRRGKLFTEFANRTCRNGEEKMRDPRNRKKGQRSSKKTQECLCEEEI
jgi:hypothetical protein